MRATLSLAISLAMIGALAGGCGPSSDTNGPTNGGNSKEPKPPVPPPVPKNPGYPIDKTPQKELPQVLESDDSVVQVHETLPDATLKNLDGEEKTLSQLQGARFTLVVFWTDEGRLNQSALSSLRLALEHAPEGVTGVSVYEGQDPEAAKAIPAVADAKFPTLLDPDRAYFAKIASGTLPRVYILDKDRKVLWYCAGFDAGRKSDFEKAKDFLFGEKKATP